MYIYAHLTHHHGRDAFPKLCGARDGSDGDSGSHTASAPRKESMRRRNLEASFVNLLYSLSLQDVPHGARKTIHAHT